LALAPGDDGVLNGLVVGKFCPLHLGHQRLIEFAAARCDRLIILSYTKPEFPAYPPTLRAKWLETLFPDAVRLVLDDAALADFTLRTGSGTHLLPANDAPEEVHREFCAWVCHRMLGLSVDRVFTSESYGDGFAASLTRYFSGHAGTTHRVEHLAYDPARATTPVSGSAIRHDPDGQSAFLPDPVRSSLVRRIGIIGGESSGKTTLARLLAERYDTIWVPEYGRELWVARDGALLFEDLHAIAAGQIAREEAATLSARRRLFCDTTPLVTAFYSEAMFGRVDPALLTMAGRRYDHILLCAPDFAFVQDGTRRDTAFRQRQHDHYVQALAAEGVPYREMTGSIMERLSLADEILRVPGPMPENPRVSRIF
jgi:HTH-type transcriptional repressor of NAD biosynthesis genes